MPHERALTAEEKESAKKMLELQCNKKLLQQKLSQDTGKVITLRDLTNLTRKFNKDSERSLYETVKTIKDKYSKFSIH